MKETEQHSAKKRGQNERHGDTGTGKYGFREATSEQKAMEARMRCFYLRLQLIVGFTSFLHCCFVQFLEANVSSCLKRCRLVLIWN